MSEKNWVPGFIWLTPRGQDVHTVEDGKNVWRCVPSPPMLVAVNQITDLRPHKRTPGERDTLNTCVSVCGNADTFVDVVETVEEIAELIRREWENRVSRDAEIRWASTTGERR